MTAEPYEGTRPRLLRVALESLAIVLSILLAFAIDAGWDERQERLAEIEILEGLLTQFEGYREAFARRADRYIQVGDDIVWLLDEADFSAADVARMDRAMLAFVGAPTADLRSGPHTELVASGRISLISDAELRSRISNWQSLLDETTDNELVVRQYIGSVTVPFLAARGAPIGRISRVPKQGQWELSVASDAEALTAYRELVGDPEFRALATWRYEWALGSAGDFRRAEHAADSVLTLVRAELGT